MRACEPGAAILVVSAINSHETAMEAVALGACGFLTKPFTAIELDEALGDLARFASGGGAMG